MIYKIDRIGDAKRLGLRAEILQKIAQMCVCDDCSVSHKFPSFVSAVEPVAAGETNEESREPVRMGVADEQQALVAQLVEQVCKSRRHGLLVEFPNELEDFFVN